jgi:hypothetical protein
MENNPSFSFGYSFDDRCLNGEDYEYNPKLGIWLTYKDYNREIVENCQFEKSYIKKFLTKGEDLERKAKDSKYGKKVMKRYKKEKKGIQEYKKERADRKNLRKTPKKSSKSKSKKSSKSSSKKKKSSKSSSKKKNIKNIYQSSRIVSFNNNKNDDNDDTDDDDTDTDSELSSDESDLSDSSETSETGSGSMSDDSMTDSGSISEDEYNYRYGNIDPDHIEEGHLTIKEKEIKCYKESSKIGPFNCPGNINEIIRGDENLWTKLYVYSKHSGQTSIDVKESKYIERTLQSGVTNVPINYLLLQIHNWRNNLSIADNVSISSKKNDIIKLSYNTSFFTPKLAEIKRREYYEKYTKDDEDNKIQINDKLIDKIERKVLKVCTKGYITFEFEFNNISSKYLDNVINSIKKIESTLAPIDLVTYIKMSIEQRKLSNKKTTIRSNVNSNDNGNMELYVPYNSTLHSDILNKGMFVFFQNYITSMYTSDDKKQRPLIPPSNRQLKKMHLAFLQSEQGITPVIEFFQRDKQELYDDDSEKYMLGQLNASLDRYGLDTKSFINIVNSQFSEKGSNINPYFMKCVEAVCNVGIFGAIHILYTSDIRYGNVLYTEKGKEVGLDSWDKNISEGISNGGDCEDMGSMAIEILNIIRKGRNIGNNVYGWKSDVLNCARKILKNRCLSGVASTVTDAFIDERGNPISNKKIEKLPFIGDKFDMRSRTGGHFFGISASKANLAKWLKNSVDFNSNDITPKMKKFLNKPYCDWEYNQNTLVLEGTAPINPYVGPLKTIFKNNLTELNKQLTQKSLFKFIKTQQNTSSNTNNVNPLKERKTPFDINKEILQNHDPSKLKIFNEILMPESLPFNTGEYQKNSRISTFYKDIVHFLDENIYNKDHIFSQLVFCYKDKQKFGVDLGHILLDLGNKESNIMLMNPFINKDSIKKERDLWDNAIVPMMDTVRNQQPISIIALYDKEEQKKLVVSKRIWENNTNISNDINTSYNCGYGMNKQKKIYVHVENKKYVINNDTSDPVLTIVKGKLCIINVNAIGHPFWIKFVDGEEHPEIEITNNGIEKGEIRVFIPWDVDYIPKMIYKCGLHSYMKGNVDIIIVNNKMITSQKNNGDDDGHMPNITYKYKKWSYKKSDPVYNKDDITIMRWFTRSTFFDSNKGLDKALINEMNHLITSGLISDYVCYEQRFLPQCEKIIEIHLFANVKQ